MLETEDRRINELEAELTKLHNELQRTAGECKRMGRDNSMFTERVTDRVAFQ